MATDNDFRKCLEFTLKWEGHYVNNPLDRGGPTNMGITLAAAQKAYLDKNKDGRVDAEDIKLLEPEDALAVYRGDYWVPSGACNSPMPICACIFDFACNSGPGRAASYLKRITDQTDWKTYLQLRKDFLVLVVKKNPSQQVFMKGWLNRVNDLYKFCEINHSG